MNITPSGIFDWEVEYTTKDKITQQLIDDLLCTAFEGGISYWCSEIDPGQYPIGATYGHECLSRGQDIKIHDSEDNVWYTLKLMDYLKGIVQEVQTYPYPSMMVMYDEHDAETADHIVQYALFGELRYG